MLMMVVFIQLLVVSSLCIVLGEQFNVGFLIEHASLDQVNGIYICSSDSRCSSIASSNTLTLASSHAIVNGEVQKRWFISTSNNTITTNLYGAIELANEPEVKLKTWKRLGTDAAFEPEMTIQSIPEYNLVTFSMAEKSVEHLLLCANVLIAAYQHNDLDRKSDRGRYIYSALIQYSLLQDANYKDNLLVRLYKCDFMAVLGGIGRAGDCYDEIIAQMTLQISFGDTNNTSHTTVTYGTIIKDYSALQCMRTHKAASTDNEHQYSIELLRCHQHCAIMRQLRHSLIHQLDPSRALDIATQNSHLLTVKGCKVWTLLALCMLGYCHSGQVFYTTESSLLSVHTEVSYRNATLNIGVPVSTTVAECDVILAYLSAHGDNEVVHTLFTKIVFRLSARTPQSHYYRRTSIQTI